MRTWNCSCHNAWNIHGHSHNNLKPIGKQMDAGVDTHNFKPWSFEEVKEVMRTREDNEDFKK
jgi:calcineurin-like phosphoesterase family protein